MAAYIYDVELRRALIDPSSSTDTMPLSTIEAIGTPEERNVEQLIDVSGFGGSTSFNIGYINLDLNIRPMQVVTRFHVIDALTPIRCCWGNP